MDNQINIRWVCLDSNCNLGRVVDSVPEILLHSRQQHKLIKFNKFREMIITLFDDSYLSCLQNEQHYLIIINSIQTLISSLKKSLQNFENSYKQKLDEFYEQIHPRQMFIKISQAIMKQDDIDKEIMNAYLDNYIKIFDINQNTQQQLDKLQNQIQNFCQSQKLDWEAIFEKQLKLLPETPNDIEPQQIIPLIKIKQQNDNFDINKSSQEIQFTNNYTTAKILDQIGFLYYKGVEKLKKVIMKVELNILNQDDYIFNIGFANKKHNPNNYQGCYLLTHMGTLLLEQETLESNLKVNNGSIVKVRYSKKHPSKIFFQIDNNQQDRIKLKNCISSPYFIIIIKNVQIQLI